MHRNYTGYEHVVAFTQLEFSQKFYFQKIAYLIDNLALFN